MDFESEYLDDEVVRVDDEEQRQKVNEDWVDKDVAAAEPVLGQVVCSTGCHVAFRHIPVKSIFLIRLKKPTLRELKVRLRVLNQVTT